MAKEQTCGFVVLCGGRSSRMKTDKSKLEIDGLSMLERVTDIGLEMGLTSIVVGGYQSNPPDWLASKKQVTWLTDQVSDQGPLEGIRTGLKYLADSCDAAIVVGCDSPLLNSAVLRLLLSHFSDREVDIACPVVEGRRQPIPAVFSTHVFDTIESLLRQDQSAIWQLVEQLRVAEIAETELKTVDPELCSFWNANDLATFDKISQRIQAKK